MKIYQLVGGEMVETNTISNDGRNTWLSNNILFIIMWLQEFYCVLSNRIPSPFA